MVTSLTLDMVTDTAEFNNGHEAPALLIAKFKISLTNNKTN